MSKKVSLLALLIAGLLLCDNTHAAREDGKPTRAGLFPPVLVTTSSSSGAAKAKAKKAKKKPKKKKRNAAKKPTKKQRAKPAQAAPPPPEAPPEPFIPFLLFAVSTPPSHHWYLILEASSRTFDVFRSLPLNGTMWVYHGKEETRRYKLEDIGALHGLVAASGREASEVEPLCRDDSAVAFSHWKDGTQTVRVAYRQMKLGNETFTAVFHGQWPAWNNHIAAYHFDEMVCGGWLWWQVQW